MDFAAKNAYLAASMKRLLAFAALLLGLSALAAPAQARVYYASADAQIARVERGGGMASMARVTDSAEPRASRARTSRAPGSPATSRPRTVLLPVIMLADRPLE